MTPPEPLAVPPRDHGAQAPAVSLLVLRKRPDFLRAARAARQGMPGFLLQARQRAPGDGPEGAARVGFTCSKKLGNAVARNRARRRLRELARKAMPQGARPGWDYVLVGRPEATLSRDFAAMLADLEQALRKVHRPRPPKPPAKGGRA